jgi:hypothetical protein
MILDRFVHVLGALLAVNLTKSPSFMRGRSISALP